MKVETGGTEKRPDACAQEFAATEHTDWLDLTAKGRDSDLFQLDYWQHKDAFDKVEADTGFGGRMKGEERC